MTITEFERLLSESCNNEELHEKFKELGDQYLKASRGLHRTQFGIWLHKYHRQVFLEGKAELENKLYKDHPLYPKQLQLPTGYSYKANCKAPEWDGLAWIPPVKTLRFTVDIFNSEGKQVSCVKGSNAEPEKTYKYVLKIIDDLLVGKSCKQRYIL